MYNGEIKRVHVELSDKCNAECPICPRSHYGGIVHPNIKNIQLGLEYFKLLGPEFIQHVDFWLFCGTRGDPMANTEIVDIIEYIYSINPKTQMNINTNGSLGSAKQFKRLSEIFGQMRGGHAKIVFSVDGWEDTNHIYRKNVKWEKVMRNMKAYLEGPGLAQWDYLIFNHNKHQIPLVQKFCEENNIYLELKEPAGFDFNNTPELTTIPVHNRKDGMYMYEIYPDITSEGYSSIRHTAVEARSEKKKFNSWGVDSDNRNRFYNREIIATTKQYRSQPMLARMGYDDMFTRYGFLKKHKNLDISCQAINTNELFIDCDGMFLPCCFIGGSWFAGDNQLKDMIGDKSILYPSETWTAKDILNTKFFQKTLPDGMSGELDDPVGHCARCVMTCGKMPTAHSTDLSQG